ncbi:hypothetical protein ACHAXA_008238 [Cyclostephanos tholiformis]|uniref:Uncharacterized protein n=1 Tax=Cyclostephanos tholiformis TaxID=382380 RepID=A0ABD3RH97_9STRA
MGSPCIDIDMNLMSSPDPSERDGGSGDDNIGVLPTPTHSAVDDRPLNGDALNDQATTLDVNVDDRSHPSHSNSNHALQSTTEGEIPHDYERMIADDLTTRHYEAMTMTAMVESWMEELHTMNVKNSILLDDLVKLGADSVEECL